MINIKYYVILEMITLKQNEYKKKLRSNKNTNVLQFM